MFYQSYSNKTVLENFYKKICFQPYICFCSNLLFCIFSSPLKKVFGNSAKPLCVSHTHIFRKYVCSPMLPQKHLSFLKFFIQIAIIAMPGLRHWKGESKSFPNLFSNPFYLYSAVYKMAVMNLLRIRNKKHKGLIF